MGDKLRRLEMDRALFARGNRQQLVDLIEGCNPNLVAGAITRALELQVVTDEIARERGVEIDDAAVADYCDRRREYLNRQLDRSINTFICSIVSQEG